MQWIVQPYIHMPLSPSCMKKVSSFDLGLDAKKTNISLTVLNPSSWARARGCLGLASFAVLGRGGRPSVILGNLEISNCLADCTTLSCFDVSIPNI